MTMLIIAILLFFAIIFCAVGMFLDEDNTMLYLFTSSLCGIGCIVSIGYYFGGM